MSNHVHSIVIPIRSDSLFLPLKHTHGPYAAYFNARHGGLRSGFGKDSCSGVWRRTRAGVRRTEGLQIRPTCTYSKREPAAKTAGATKVDRSEEHTSELQSLRHLVCRLLLEK